MLNPTETDQLVSHIAKSFPDSQKLESSTLLEAYDYYRFGPSAGVVRKPRVKEEKLNWTLVDDKYIETYWSGLNYMSRQSLYFYLPAIMTFASRRLSASSDLLELFIDRLRGELDENENSHFFDHFSKEAIAAIIAFIKFAGVNCSDDYAIEQYKSIAERMTKELQ